MSGFPWQLHYRDICKVIADMLTVNAHNAIKRFCDAVNAECLGLCRIVGLCFDDAFLGDPAIVLSCDGIFQKALKQTVSLLGNLAGDGICQSADTKSGEVGGAGGIEYRDHRQHHLGIILISDTPPLTVSTVSPGGSSGKPSPVTLSFRSVVP